MLFQNALRYLLHGLSSFLVAEWNIKTDKLGEALKARSLINTVSGERPTIRGERERERERERGRGHYKPSGVVRVETTNARQARHHLATVRTKVQIFTSVWRPYFYQVSSKVLPDFKEGERELRRLSFRQDEQPFLKSRGSTLNARFDLLIFFQASCARRVSRSACCNEITSNSFDLRFHDFFPPSVLYCKSLKVNN